MATHKWIAFIITKVDTADKRSLSDFETAFVFIPIIVMPIVASLNIISVTADAADAAADFDGVCDGVDASVCERMWTFSQLIVVAIQIDLS